VPSSITRLLIVRFCRATTWSIDESSWTRSSFNLSYQLQYILLHNVYRIYCILHSCSQMGMSIS